MSWLITLLLAIVLLAVLLPLLLLLLAVIDHPRTEEGWRRELACTGGLEHIILADAYRICHHRKGRKNAEKKQSAPRSAVAGSQGLYARNGASSGQADSRVGGYNEKPGHDDDYHELPRRGDPGAPDRTFQDAPQGAGSEGSPASSRPADKQRKNRSSEDGSESAAGEPLQAGSGGRIGGSGAGSEQASFWETLVENGKRLGV